MMAKLLYPLTILAGIASALDFGPSALAYIGAKQTCIKSTSYPGERCFYTFIPDCAGEDAPLVFDIHGYGSSPQYSSFYTGWISKATENCFVVVLPSGNIESPATLGDDNACWAMPAGLTNANGTDALPCCCSTPSGFTDADYTDDTTFLRNVAVSVIQDVVPKETSNKVTIDSKRIYMAGHSNGCTSSIAMGTVHSDLVAGVCCHAGMAQASFPSSYQPTPMWITHGTLDPDLPYDGFSLILPEMFGIDGEIQAYSTLGAQATLDVISEVNGCTLSKTLDVDHPSNTITRYISDGCVNDKSVELLVIGDVGHFPYAGLSDIGLEYENGTVPTNVDTTQLAWDFCSQYSLEVEPELILTTPKSDASTLYYGHASKAVQVGFFALMWILH